MPTESAGPGAVAEDAPEATPVPYAEDFDGASLPQLHLWLADPHPEIRASAACAVGDRLRSREVGSSALSADLRDTLAGRLADDVPAVRFEAAIAMAELQDHRATAALLQAIGTRRLRLDGIRALGAMGDPAGIEPLRRILQRRFMPWADRLQAAAALCALNDGAGHAYLLARTDSKRRAERAAALHFMGESKHPEALSLLLHVLRDKQDPLRDVSVRALGWLGDPAAKAPLRQALTETGGDEELITDIHEALARVERLENLGQAESEEPEDRS